MWNCLSLKSEPPNLVVPFTMTSMVVPRFSNSTGCSGISRTGFSVAIATVESMKHISKTEDHSCEQDLYVPTLMGDWFLPVLQASFSGARDAQFKGPIRPV
jgi:hypothetical protein